MKKTLWLVAALAAGYATQSLAAGFGTPTVDGVLDAVYNAPEASDPSDEPQGNAPMDLLDLYVCNDNDFWYFYFTVDDDIVATNWGKYLLYIDTTGDGSGATFDAWGRNVAVINPNGLPEYSLNGWVDGGGVYDENKTQLWHWTGAAWTQEGMAADAALLAGTPSAIEWKVSRAALGDPATIWCEVFSTGGGGGDNAQDTINDPADDWNATDWATQAQLFDSCRPRERQRHDAADRHVGDHDRPGADQRSVGPVLRSSDCCYGRGSGQLLDHGWWRDHDRRRGPPGGPDQGDPHPW